MLNIKGVLVSDAIVQNYFCCHLSACQGFCCLEGDVGAPLSPDEIADLEDYYPLFQQYMTPEGIAKIELSGTFDYDMEGEFVTPLLDDEACAYVYYEENIAKCAIEKAFFEGKTEFQKPISCHLYPIRINKLPDCDALNYHQWGVCESACIKGSQQKMPIYKFLKTALIRKYGENWYQELELEATKLGY